MGYVSTRVFLVFYVKPLSPLLLEERNDGSYTTFFIDKTCPSSQSFSPGNAWKSKGARFDEYVGCGKTDQWKPFNTEVIRRAYDMEHCRAKDKFVLKTSHGTCHLLLTIVVSPIEIRVLGDRFTFSFLLFMGRNSSKSGSSQSQKKMSMIALANGITLNFFGVSSYFVFYHMDDFFDSDV